MDRNWIIDGQGNEVMRKNTIEKICNVCGCKFVIPQCRDWREHSCSTECKVVARNIRKEILKKERTRVCLCCGDSFVVKKSQIDRNQGKYCSLKCSHKMALTPARMSPEAQEKKRKSWMRGFKQGLYKIYKGEKNKQWTGGPKEARRRWIESGKSAEYIREYRKKNKHRVREWSQKRSFGRVSRLPWGTIPNLGKKQSWKCAACRCSIKESYHVDHIIPFVLGGKHIPENLQLLCSSCNLHKSGKHPISFMQQMGYLL